MIGRLAISLRINCYHGWPPTLYQLLPNSCQKGGMKQQVTSTHHRIMAVGHSSLSLTSSLRNESYEVISMSTIINHIQPSLTMVNRQLHPFPTSPHQVTTEETRKTVQRVNATSNVPGDHPGGPGWWMAGYISGWWMPGINGSGDDPCLANHDGLWCLATRTILMIRMILMILWLRCSMLTVRCNDHHDLENQDDECDTGNYHVITTCTLYLRYWYLGQGMNMISPKLCSRFMMADNSIWDDMALLVAGCVQQKATSNEPPPGRIKQLPKKTKRFNGVERSPLDQQEMLIMLHTLW